MKPDEIKEKAFQKLLNGPEGIKRICCAAPFNNDSELYNTIRQVRLEEVIGEFIEHSKKKLIFNIVSGMVDSIKKENYRVEIISNTEQKVHVEK